MSELGLNSKDRKSTRDKANISNPKVNRCCVQLTANRTSTDCVQISLGPSIPYIPLGIYHSGGFNAMFYTMPNFVHHFKSISEVKLELQSGNAKFASKLTGFFVLRDLEISWMTLKNNRAPHLHFIKLFQACGISKPLVYSNWSYSPETLNSGQNWRFFVPRDLEN